jgi:hypothetical protein
LYALVTIFVGDGAASAAVVHAIRPTKEINKKKMLTIKHRFLAAI